MFDVLARRHVVSLHFCTWRISLSIQGGVAVFFTMVLGIHVSKSTDSSSGSEINSQDLVSVKSKIFPCEFEGILLHCKKEHSLIKSQKRLLFLTFEEHVDQLISGILKSPTIHNE